MLELEEPEQMYFFNSERYEENPKRKKGKKGKKIKGGLPKSLIKKYGISKKAWAVHRANKNPRKKPKKVTRRKPKIKYKTRTVYINPKNRKYKKRTNYAPNPRKKRRNSLKKNPKLGFNKDVGILKPSLKGYKGKGLLPGVGVTILGIADTSIISLLLRKVALKQFKIAGYKDWIIGLGGGFVVATLISYVIAKGTKKPQLGKQHQLGVYFGTAGALVGLLITKFAKNKLKLKLTGVKEIPDIDFVPTPKNIVLELFGFGEINRGLVMNKIATAITNGDTLHMVKDGENESQVGLLNGTTGDMLLTGTYDGISNFVNGFNLYEGEDKSPNNFGEDITWEA